MVPISRRMLAADRRRTALGIAGVAAALAMTLALGGITAGSTRQVSRFIDVSPADVIVSQRGVRTVHMSISVLAPEVIEQVAAAPGVSWSEPILLVSGSVRSGPMRSSAYVVGYQIGGQGGPPRVVTGAEPGPGQIVIDQRTASVLGVGMGDTVEVLGRTWTVSGLTVGMTSLVNTVVYVSYQELGELLGRAESASYVLVGSDGDPAATAMLLAEATGHTAQTRRALSAEERALVRAMTTDLMDVMAVTSFVAALAVTGLVLSATVLSRLREIGIMMALGMGRIRITRMVLSQALLTVGAASAGAVGVALALGFALSRWAPDLDLVLEWGSLLRTIATGLAAAMAGSLAPAVKLYRLDPVTAFRRS